MFCQGRSCFRLSFRGVVYVELHRSTQDATGQDISSNKECMTVAMILVVVDKCVATCWSEKLRCVVLCHLEGGFTHSHPSACRLSLTVSDWVLISPLWWCPWALEKLPAAGTLASSFHRSCSIRAVWLRAMTKSVVQYVQLASAQMCMRLPNLPVSNGESTLHVRQDFWFGSTLYGVQYGLTCKTHCFFSWTGL